MKRSLLLLALIPLTFSQAACTTRIDPGHVGTCKTSKGFTGGILGPGRHDCWGMYEEMYLLSIKDAKYDLKLNVMVKDKLNMKFDIAIMVSVNTDKTELLKSMFTNITPEENHKITLDQIFETYGRDVVDQEVRLVVSKYETTDIAARRGEIVEEITQKVRKVFEGSVLKVKYVTVNNLDFPPIVTRAQESKKKMQVEIETEKANQAKKLLVAETSFAIAHFETAKQLLDAQGVADANKILSNSITPGYLEYKRIEAMKNMAKTGDLIMMPYEPKSKLPANIAQAPVFDINVKERIKNLRAEGKKKLEAKRIEDALELEKAH